MSIRRTVRFARGACPGIDYQRAYGAGDKVKTLETDSNYVKAALLLYQVTGDRPYLAKAERKYQAIRKYYLSPGSALYTAHVIDSGSSCVQVRGLFFASVNGNMIWDGASLASDTGTARYLTQAVATARAASRILCDSAGTFTDLQTEADVAEPLVEGMSCSPAPIMRRLPGTGCFRRPRRPLPSAPRTQPTAGLLQRAAAAGPGHGLAGERRARRDDRRGKLDPTGVPADPWYRRNAAFVPNIRVLPPGPRGAVRLTLTGTAVAITGTLGIRSSEGGHARILIDGKPMGNRVGICRASSAARACWRPVALRVALPASAPTGSRSPPLPARRPPLPTSR